MLRTPSPTAPHVSPAAANHIRACQRHRAAAHCAAVRCWFSLNWPSAIFPKNLWLPRGCSHRLDDLHRLDAHARHAHQQVDDLLLVVGEAVGVELLADGRVLRRLFLVLVENPFQRRAVAELVVPASGGTPVSCVSLSSRMLPASLSALSIAFGASPALRDFLVRRVDALQRPRLDRLVADVQRPSASRPSRPSARSRHRTECAETRA